MAVWERSRFVHHSLALANRELCSRLGGAGVVLSFRPFELRPDKVHVVPNGVDTSLFRFGPAPMPLPGDSPGGRPFGFLFVEGTILRKRIDVLLAAYSSALGPHMPRIVYVDQDRKPQVQLGIVAMPGLSFSARKLAMK